MKNIPSKIARRLAGAQEWGSINSCRQFGAGVWLADCSGHGGLIFAVDRVEDLVKREALRELIGAYRVIERPVHRNRVQTYVDRPGSSWYVDQLPGCESVEWFVAEEDCEAALAILAIPEVAEHLARDDRPVEVVLADAAESARRWFSGPAVDTLVSSVVAAA
jgi:hypothetical protein